ncbi:MAG: hypothetical protein L0J63_13830 [Tetragenococcus koreensis]|nr:hypothetical protein [Tetragenococcus koreensis]
MASLSFTQLYGLYLIHLFFFKFVEVSIADFPEKVREEESFEIFIKEQ